MSKGDKRINLKVSGLDSIFKQTKINKIEPSRLHKINLRLKAIDRQITKLTNEERELIWEKTRIEVALEEGDKHK